MENKDLRDTFEKYIDEYIAERLDNVSIDYGMQNALNVLNKVPFDFKGQNENVVYRMKEFIAIFRKILLNNSEKISKYIPPLSFHWSKEDHSLLIEWIFQDFRIGFNFEPDDNQSSWYFVTKKYNCAGNMNFEKTKLLCLNAINYVISKKNDQSWFNIYD